MNDSVDVTKADPKPRVFSFDELAQALGKGLTELSKLKTAEAEAARVLRETSGKAKMVAETVAELQRSVAAHVSGALDIKHG